MQLLPKWIQNKLTGLVIKSKKHHQKCIVHFCQAFHVVSMQSLYVQYSHILKNNQFVNPAEVKSRISPKTKIIDVREPIEFNSSKRLVGARNVPCSTISAEDFKSMDRQEEVLVYCKSGGRAKRSADKLHELGFTNVVCVQNGGIDQLAQEGVAVEENTNSKVWSLDRQVRFTAGSLVLVGTAVSLTVNPMVGMLISGGIGGGLVFSAVTDTCGMGMLLAKMPWNKVCDDLLYFLHYTSRATRRLLLFHQRKKNKILLRMELFNSFNLS